MFTGTKIVSKNENNLMINTQIMKKSELIIGFAQYKSVWSQHIQIGILS